MTGKTTVLLVAWACLALLLLLPPASAAADCEDVYTSPVADFSFEIVPAETAPIMVNFYSTSDGGRNEDGGMTDPVESYAWKFGDGDTSGNTNPLHTYAVSSARFEQDDKPFAVTLTVRTECGRSSSTTKNVTVYCIGQKAGFTIVQPAGEGPYEAPVAVYLKDTSLHVADEVTTYHYTLWDSGMTRLFKESTEKDPAFIISNGGRYVIRQEVFKGCSNPSPPDMEMRKNIEVTGSAASDAIPMETIPFTTTVTESVATTPPAATAAPVIPAAPVTAALTTVPVPVPEEIPPGTGRLSVATTPAGAQVFVNNVLLGSSPASIPGLSPGLYNLRLEKSGYRSKSVRVEIGDGRVTEYSVALEAESGGPGIELVLAAVIIVAAGAGGAYWYMKKKKKPPVKPDWNNPG